MTPITTHVLDTSRGRPAEGIRAVLEFHADGAWKAVGEGRTNADGRILGLMREGAKLEKGTYRLTFETGAYFQSLDLKGFYPSVTIQFEIREPEEHYHVPLLLSPNGYSTYRGS